MLPEILPVTSIVKMLYIRQYRAICLYSLTLSKDFV